MSRAGGQNQQGQLHRHPLRAMNASGPQRQMTDEERKQRQQAIDMHLILLVHASSCRLGADCKSRHCAKMKDILLHVQVPYDASPPPRPSAHSAHC